MSELDLPEGWEPKTLIDLADYINGFPFKPSDWSETGLPIVRIAQITGSSLEYDYFRGSISNLYRLETGDIIFSWSGTLCVVRWHGGQAWLNQHLFRVTPYQGIDVGFFFHLLSNAVENMEKSAHGSTMKHIKRGELKKYNVVIPVSLKEQQKIAQILDTLDTQIR
ncbi:restriction endonuclease subunit S, partial [Marinobacter salsuginis]|uniref:restriction endonuclease subunit S n=1 Tax=Marinobacter salsuginis TaxID=418719 RepID=UPI001890ADBA